jgi:alkylated DNA repair dioxygenase AlkB
MESKSGLYQNLDNSLKTDVISKEITFPEIDGLIYVSNFISCREHDELIANVDSQVWLTDLKRRVQHYGYKYDYKNHKINRDMYIAPLPEWALAIANKVHKKYSDTLPNQAIINEYEPGQGIENHIDCKTCFWETVVSLSLGSPCVMNFIKDKGDAKKSILLEPRSLIILNKAARYEWTHGIAKRKSDTWNNNKFLRSRRVSLTFRTVILSD